MPELLLYDFSLSETFTVGRLSHTYIPPFEDLPLNVTRSI